MRPETKYKHKILTIMLNIKSLKVIGVAAFIIWIIAASLPDYTLLWNI